MTMFRLNGVPDNVKTLPVLQTASSSLNLVKGYIATSNIDSSGVIVSRATSQMFYAPIVRGQAYYIQTDDDSGYVYGFFTSIPQMDSTSYDNSRVVETVNNKFNSPINGYVAFRGVVATNCGLFTQGNIAVFNTDRTDNLSKCECEIQYSQATSPNPPSPSNPLPITTFSEMNVHHGRPTTLLKGCNINSSGKIISAERYNLVVMQVIQNEEYLIYSDNMVYAYYENPPELNEISYDFSRTVGGQGYITITAPITGYIAFRYDTTLNEEAYSGMKYTIPFGQSVAKGIFGVLSGKLECEVLASVDMSQLNWTYQSSGSRFVCNSLSSTIKRPANNDTLLDDFKCEVYEPNTANSTTITQPADEVIGITTTGNIVLKDTSLNGDVTALTSILANKTLTYPLESNLIVQLTSNQITALLNENSIWCDTGDTSVQYFLSVQKWINNQT